MKVCVIFVIALIITCEALSVSRQHTKKYQNQVRDGGNETTIDESTCKLICEQICLNKKSDEKRHNRKHRSVRDSTSDSMDVCAMCKCGTLTPVLSYQTGEPQNQSGKKRHNVRAHHVSKKTLHQ
nr:uncharacterized protein LOC111424188 [Onthophagus taurus]